MRCNALPLIWILAAGAALFAMAATGVATARTRNLTRAAVMGWPMSRSIPMKALASIAVVLTLVGASATGANDDRGPGDRGPGDRDTHRAEVWLAPQSLLPPPPPVPPASWWADGRYDSLRPSVTGMRAARTAGKSPPTKPIANAHFRPSAISVGVTRNWNTIEV